jgi:calcineurin-like phosphoesterase
MPSRFEPATGNPRLNGVIVDADEATGKATSVLRISYNERDLAALTPA